MYGESGNSCEIDSDAVLEKLPIYQKVTYVHDI